MKRETADGGKRGRRVTGTGVVRVKSYLTSNRIHLKIEVSQPS